MQYYSSVNLICNAKQADARDTLSYISEIKYHKLHNVCPQKIRECVRAKESTREMYKACTVKIVLWTEIFDNSKTGLWGEKKTPNTA